MTRPRLRRAMAMAIAVPASIAIAGLSATPAVAAPGSGRGFAATVFVSTHGTDSNSCGRPFNPCATIGRGVANASSGQQVVVLPGSYTETVKITKTIRLRGIGASIDATGENQGIWLLGPHASWSTVSGFTVQNATGEGILLTSVDHVTVAQNRVANNDKGAHSTAYPPCADNGPVPGDCGEAIHLQGTTHSRIVSNLVDHNVGGILVTDESGPTSGNLIARNAVVDNAEDCGITMPSHVPGLGVTYNVVKDNFIARNGGAGVLIATPAPGTTVTNNLVTYNVILDNGEGGVQLHAHAPSQSIDDNTITHNLIGRNNTAGDSDSGDMQTTGVIVFSAVVPVNGLVIQHNAIFNDQIGIWLSANVVASGINNNSYVRVGIPIHQ
jgi:nitrous oxidase accessory protein NosD